MGLGLASGRTPSLFLTRHTPSLTRALTLSRSPAVHQLRQREAAAVLPVHGLRERAGGLPGGGRAVGAHPVRRQRADHRAHRERAAWHLPDDRLAVPRAQHVVQVAVLDAAHAARQGERRHLRSAAAEPQGEPHERGALLAAPLCGRGRLLLRRVPREERRLDGGRDRTGSVTIAHATTIAHAATVGCCVVLRRSSQLCLLWRTPAMAVRTRCYCARASRSSPLRARRPPCPTRPSPCRASITRASGAAAAAGVAAQTLTLNPKP